jgi:biopolymer transport protein ExbB
MQQLFLNAGMVAWPLGICSVLALGIILERLWTLGRLKRLEERAFLVLQMGMEKGDASGLQDPEIAGAPVTQIMASLTDLREASDESVGRAAEIALSLQRIRLRRYTGTLATIASTSPFVGLFGTVVGIMTAFEGMSSGGGQAGVDNQALMAGIAEALSATALGLLVAVPSVIAFNYFVGRVQAMLLQVNGHVARLAPLLRRLGAPPPPPAEKAVPTAAAPSAKKESGRAR